MREEQFFEDSGRGYIAVSPLMIFPESHGRFALYVRNNSRYVLYARSGEMFTREHLTRLHENNVTEVYVKADYRQRYEDYLEANLGRVLGEKTIPEPVRAKIFYEVSGNIMNSVFSDSIPIHLKNAFYNRLMGVVSASYGFLTANPASFKSVTGLISHNYRTYTHSIHVFVYTVAILHAMGFDEKTVKEFGVGAILHDIGKVTIPNAILNKPGPLSPEERQVVSTHPASGVLVCQEMTLPHNVINCILFHHEKMDGSGYPSAMPGDIVPRAVRAVTVADIYDALVSDRPYAPGITPFEALKVIMTEVESGKLDREVYKVFVSLLSGNKLLG